jgi:type I restriction enzyme S subunit
MEWPKAKPLDAFVSNGDIQLGRGNIISAIDIDRNPGDYPIYSSSAKGNGEFGRYGSYMFNEELITWSVDGGGRFFFRPEHKFSVTNVCGYMRVNPAIWSRRYVYYSLDFQHQKLSFDYQAKAHPSVIRKTYTLTPLCLDEQNKIAATLYKLDKAIEQTEALIAKQQRIKTGLMQDLLTKGIDENGNIRSEATHEFKDSPLGRIPVEWTLFSLGDLYKDPPKNGIYKPSSQIGEGILLIGQTSFTKERLIDFALARRALVSEQEIKAYGLQVGDLLVSRVFATTEGVGLPAFVQYVPESSVYESNMLRLRINNKLAYPKLVYYWLFSQSIRKKIVSSINASNQASINQQVLSCLSLAIPSISEQKRILEAIEAQDSMAANEKAILRKMQSIKTGLMHDLLTGKVRVTELLASQTSHG